MTTEEVVPPSASPTATAANTTEQHASGGGRGLLMGVGLFVALVIAAAVGAVWVSGSADDSDGAFVADDPGATLAYQDPVLGWSMDIPSDWNVQSFEHSCGGIDEAGTLVVNAGGQVSEMSDALCPGSWDLSGLSSESLVLIEIRYRRGRQSTPVPVEDTPLPVDGQLLMPPSGVADQLSLRVTIDGDGGYTIHTIVGSDATEQDRQAAVRLIESISFG